MRAVPLFTVLLLLPITLMAEPELREGEWEFDIWYDFIGVPQHFPGYTRSQCITQDNPIPTVSRHSQECQRHLQGEFGRTYTWMVNCSSEWEMVHGMGRIHYWGDRAHGDVHMQVVNPFNPPQPMIFRVRGSRLGECNEENQS